MSQTENNNSSIIQTFVNAYTETSGDMEACEKIFSEKIQNDLPSFIKTCTQILAISQEIDDNIIKAKEMSITFLVDIFDQKLYTGTSETLTNDEIVEELKNIIKQNIFSETETIRTQTIRCYALLFARLGSKWIDGINAILNSFPNSNVIPNNTIVYFSIMSEITKEENFDTSIYSSFSAQFVQMLVNALWILSRRPTEEAFTAELRTSAAKYVYNIVSSAPRVLTDNEKEGARIPNILESLPNSFRIKNVELFESIHEIFFILVKKFYSISPNFMEKINIFVMNGLQLQNEPKCTNASINFWIKVAQLEYNIIQMKKSPKKYIIQMENSLEKNLIQPLQPLLIESALPTLIPLFISYMRNIDENDTAVENLEQKPEPCMYATVAITEFYRVMPKIIFDILKDKIEECINMDKWTDVHASIQMIYSISESPVNDDVGQFIAQHFEKLIELSSPSQIPRIRETSLFVIGLVLKNYPQRISMAGEFNWVNYPQRISMDDEYTNKWITSIINTIESTLNFDQEQIKNLSYDNIQILIRITYIIYYLSSVWKNNQYASPISTFFDKFYEIIGILFNIGILNENKKIIQNSCDSLNQLILNSTSNCVSKLDSIYADRFMQITKTKELACKEETRDWVLSSYISNLSGLLHKLKKVRSGIDIISKYALQTLECLYGILDANKSSCIYDKGLDAISSLISATNITPDTFYFQLVATNITPDTYIEIFNPDSINKLLSDFIQTGLSSSNEDVLKSTCILIGNLFHFLAKKIPDLNHYSSTLFSSIAKLLIENKKKKRSCNPYLFYAISGLFYNADPNLLKSANLEKPLRELLTSYYDVSITLDMLNQKDIEYGNLLYQYLTDAFGSYACVFYDPSDRQIERNQLVLLDKLARFIYELFPKIDDNVYRSFGNTARQFANNCSRKNNVALNGPFTHRILKSGFENCHQPDLRKKLRDTSDYLRSK